MPDLRLAGKRILVTQAGDFMGPALCEVLAEYGAEVLPSTDSLAGPDSPAQVVAAAGRLDVLVANLAITAPSTPVADVGDEEWTRPFRLLSIRCLACSGPCCPA